MPDNYNLPSKSCPYCDSDRTVRNGYRDTHTLGRRRRLICRGCGRKFSTAPSEPGAPTLREEIHELRRRIEALEKSAINDADNRPEG